MKKILLLKSQEFSLGTQTLTDVAREGVDSDESIRAGTHTHKGAPSDRDENDVGGTGLFNYGGML
ncbi:hypothetical protein HRE53_33155 (plasmid) [Acaryochloris sp. 'Moss Beach']|uniref:hypothetical protein n=1 Tax=Acaryochloris sp. 'Moss Beach' TaxID=2740837 RepID=UPI001F2E8A01|nr:hypothetical protein [Acaryochloris sp. 'Moss Beach']UJB73461.1 hypothetical protein HRE53_33155 [Acaryochloris sp. 'Moss Beach']